MSPLHGSNDAFTPYEKSLILGAAGRDFHNFNVVFRNNPEFHVVAFTATQIPDIAGRRYPAELAGSLSRRNSDPGRKQDGRNHPRRTRRRRGLSPTAMSRMRR